MNIERTIIESEITKSLGNDFTLDKALDLQETILKGKKAQIGEVREWSGGKYRKTSSGWERIKESGKGSQGSQDNGINDNLQVNRDTTASKKGEDPMKVPEGVDQAQYKDIVSDQSDRPSIHSLTIDGNEVKVNREIDRSGGQFTPYYQIEGGNGKKYWDLNAMIGDHRRVKNSSNIYSGSKISGTGNQYYQNLLNTLNSSNSTSLLIPEHKLGSWRETENAVSGSDWKVSRSIGENGEWEIGGKYYKFTKR